MTMLGEHLDIVQTEGGRRNYRFTTPLMEEYGLAPEPYREFRRGVRIVTYKKDSLSTVDATLTADYAIYYTDRELWEARGNVVAETSGGRTLYTEQLFWNAKTRRIYSNVDTKVVQADGVFYGEGFESDDEMRDWRFRRTTGRMEVETRRRDAGSAAASPQGGPAVPADSEKPSGEPTDSAS